MFNVFIIICEFGQNNMNNYIYLTLRNKIIFFYLMVLLNSFLTRAQRVFEYAPPIHIKSVQFFGPNKYGSFPLVELGEKITLIFDDLRGEETDFYYKIKHFNFDWTPSSLFQNEFIEGLDNLRIENYRTSFNTLQNYTNYRLEIPNENIELKVSGNYLLEIYNVYDELVFSRKFCVYENISNVQASVFRPQNMNNYNTHQSIHFAVTPQQEALINPQENVFIRLLQNWQWDSEIIGLKPQYFSGKTIEYRYELPSQFEGGNEYYFFDTKDLRITSPNISFVNKADLYETFLNVNTPRLNQEYIFNQDINGGFEIRNVMRPGDPNHEADYSYVYFSLATNYKLNDDEIYIYGGFNNFNLDDYNRMYYNPSLEIYEGVLLLKQGFYNYKYVLKKNGMFYKNGISGTHALTENEYLILVYYRNVAYQYDSIIGIGNTSSFNLRN